MTKEIPKHIEFCKQNAKNNKTLLWFRNQVMNISLKLESELVYCQDLLQKEHHCYMYIPI